MPALDNLHQLGKFDIKESRKRDLIVNMTSDMQKTSNKTTVALECMQKRV